MVNSELEAIMTKPLSSDLKRIWENKLTNVIITLDQYSKNKLTFDTASKAIDDYFSDDEEIRDFFLSSLAEAYADLSEFETLIEFLGKLPRKEEVIDFLNSPYGKK
jgi:hypothetical protein